MTDIVEQNPDFPDETQLTETPTTLYAISELFDRLGPRAEQMFVALESLERSTAAWSRSHYGYDGFQIDEGMILLKGSYYSRCDGTETTSFHVNYKDFFDPEYLGRKQARAAEVQAAAAAMKVREEETSKAQQEAAEREQYARLQAKFGG
jgi:hypothetical protein